MTASTAVLREDIAGGVCLLTLNRPDKKNAFNIAQAVGLRDAVRGANADASVRVIVVTGAGDAFSAGADMKTFAGQDEGDVADLPWVARLHEPLLECDKPLIAAVNGLAVGMGVTLLPFFDIVWASTKATFSTPFVRLGIVVEYGASWTLPRLIGRQRAAELLLRGTPIDAATALEWGLVARLLPPERLLPETLALAADVAEGGLRAVRETRRLLRAGEAETSFDRQFAAEQQVLASCYGSEEHMAQVMKFLSRKRS